MNCMDDPVYIPRKLAFIFHSQFTPENLEFFALEMESLITSEMKRIKLKEQVVTLLHVFGMKCNIILILGSFLGTPVF